MKLICETCTINRSVAWGKRAFQKTILAIGKGSERKGDETKIMLITTANKAGTKYSVLKNISKIFTRFLEEGKATISFVTPEHDVQIKSDKVQLTAFLKVLKLVLTGSGQPAEGTQPVTNPFSPSGSTATTVSYRGEEKSLHSRFSECPGDQVRDNEQEGLPNERLFPLARVVADYRREAFTIRLTDIVATEASIFKSVQQLFTQLAPRPWPATAERAGAVEQQIGRLHL